MKDILLFTPIDENVRGQREFVPLGLLYISSYLSSKGFEVDILHDTFDKIKPGYKFYGISSTTSQYSRCKRALNFIRKIEPTAKVILGGAHLNAPISVKVGLNDGWDYLVIGEGEEAVLRILTDPTLDRVVHGTMILDLDSLPFPDYNKLNLNDYSFPIGDGSKCINIITSRGCPYACAFCSTSRTKLRQRSPDNILEEINLLKSKYQFESFMFVDDTMSIKKQRYLSILDGLKQINTKWRSYGRVNVLDRECLENMVDSGCLEVAIGVESGNQEILDLIGKGTNVQKNIEFTNLCRDIGLKCNAMIIVGLPNESPKTIQDTRYWVEKARPAAFGYNILFPFPDSPLVRDYNIWKDKITIYPYDWDFAFTKAANKVQQCYVSTPYLSREEILQAYQSNFDAFVSITGFDPRIRN